MKIVEYGTYCHDQIEERGMFEYTLSFVCFFWKSILHLSAISHSCLSVSRTPIFINVRHSPMYTPKDDNEILPLHVSTYKGLCMI